jgi:hypothetical protein
MCGKNKVDLVDRVDVVDKVDEMKCSSHSRPVCGAKAKHSAISTQSADIFWLKAGSDAGMVEAKPAISSQHSVWGASLVWDSRHSSSGWATRPSRGLTG